MQVTLNSIKYIFTSFEPAINKLSALFNSLLEAVSSCWGNRKATPVEIPSGTAKKADATFNKAVLQKMPFHESRFPKALWDLAAGVDVKDLSFLESIEKTLNDSDKKELAAHLEKKNKIEFIAFLRRLDNFEDRLHDLKSILNQIRTGQTTREALMLKVRDLREYFINRSSHFTKNTGQDKGGIVEPFVAEFKEALFGPSLGFGSVYELIDGKIINHTYENHGSKKVSGWVAGFAFQEGGHAVAYVYTKNGFVKFDNSHADNTVYSVKDIFELFLNEDANVLSLLRLPLNQKLDRIPDARAWITPKWEKNNCFAAASLIFLATCQQYHDK